ncbi:MAG: hypothetical protein HYX28_10630 [Candidatus Koribacter versatilis]|uniref:Outer membrane lipoprotein-sorting protein n=1 Tax=Candidatus Korobacter versatilis TaxID=658062 RepID=A0A932A9R2_9BACT|nr:hypothetical protein [Candidatus Koribacter versatilis]
MRLRLFSLAAAIVVMTGAAFAQDDPTTASVNPAPPSGISVDQVIQKFAAKEAEFKLARDNYTYRQTVSVQTLDGDTVDGEYRQVSDILFDAQGKRTENIVFAPMSTLQRVSMSPEDQEDIRKTMPFVLTTQEIPDYNIKYNGQQRVDELDTYVFEVSPLRMTPGRRYFQGRIWVDQQDLQIVMTHGKPVPDLRKGSENLFPKFTTYREQIDGKYWFPTYTRADDYLQFKRGPVHIREIIKYTDYKRFGSNTKITYEGQEVQKAPEGQQPPPQQQPQQPPK